MEGAEVRLRMARGGGFEGKVAKASRVTDAWSIRGHGGSGEKERHGLGGRGR